MSDRTDFIEHWTRDLPNPRILKHIIDDREDEIEKLKVDVQSLQHTVESLQQTVAGLQHTVMPLAVYGLNKQDVVDPKLVLPINPGNWSKP